MRGAWAVVVTRRHEVAVGRPSGRSRHCSVTSASAAAIALSRVRRCSMRCRALRRQCCAHHATAASTAASASNSDVAPGWWRCGRPLMTIRLLRGWIPRRHRNPRQEATGGELRGVVVIWRERRGRRRHRHAERALGRWWRRRRRWSVFRGASWARAATAALDSSSRAAGGVRATDKAAAAGARNIEAA